MDLVCVLPLPQRGALRYVLIVPSAVSKRVAEPSPSARDERAASKRVAARAQQRIRIRLHVADAEPAVNIVELGVRFA